MSTLSTGASAAPTAADLTRNSVNLADSRLGAVALFCTDEFFAPMSRMLDPVEPVFIPGKYDDHGKWMDGWESRRRRRGGHDLCVVKLAAPGVLHGADIDTRHFTGNYPPAASLEGCFTSTTPGPDTDWVTLVPPTELGPDSRHLFPVAHAGSVSHVRLNIFPDGGVARLRLYGTPRPQWASGESGRPVDLASALNGAVAIAWNDSHYGHPNNLLRPDKGIDMGDGWETRRRREPGNDWCIIALGHPGTIERILVDTAHYKGNFPDRCSIQAIRLSHDQRSLTQSVVTQSMFWPVLLPEQELQMDCQHEFHGDQIVAAGPVSHVRVNVIPDGGLSRLRLIGRPDLSC